MELSTDARTWGHGCNPFCLAGVHADLVYVPREALDLGLPACLAYVTRHLAALPILPISLRRTELDCTPLAAVASKSYSPEVLDQETETYVPLLLFFRWKDAPDEGAC